ncbi:hypothetical protein [Clostridium beijerinckii]|uniref:hypothetical protein n=1 Tax=Clostridium beijerinckii TaxID=1520 RepID=UPI0018AFB75C|nr:hypothetical protein [Clostridium beijerinckii]
MKERTTNNDVEEFYDRVYLGVQGLIKSTFYSLEMFLNYTEFKKRKLLKKNDIITRNYTQSDILLIIK